MPACRLRILCRHERKPVAKRCVGSFAAFFVAGWLGLSLLPSSPLAPDAAAQSPPKLPAPAKPVERNRQPPPVASSTNDQKPKGAVLSVEEVTKELLGVEVRGLDDGQAWSECIDPQGRSLLRKYGKTYHGTVYVSVAGYQCFLYRETPQARWCWRIIRDGPDRYINELSTDGSRQPMSVIRKGVQQCDSDALVG